MKATLLTRPTPKMRAQSQFLGPGSRERFLAEIETKGELVLHSDFYGDIRWRKTAPGKFVVEWLGKTGDAAEPVV